MKTDNLTILGFLIPVAMYIAFHKFGVEWQYTALIGLPLSFLVLYLKLKRQKEIKPTDVIYPMIGAVAIMFITIYYFLKV